MKLHGIFGLKTWLKLNCLEYFIKKEHGHSFKNFKIALKTTEIWPSELQLKSQIHSLDTKS
jgi:hypothetical protein